MDGYYSIIQYCLDAKLAETVNVGLILFCPTMAYLNVQFIDDKRVKQLFSKTDNKLLKDLKTYVLTQLDREDIVCRDADEMMVFLMSLQLHPSLATTEPQWAKVGCPDGTLVELFKQMVDVTYKCGWEDSKTLFDDL